MRCVMRDDNVVENEVENEVVEFELEAQRRQFARDVVSGIRAFPNGGPNLKAKHLAEAQRLGLDTQRIADQWDSAIAQAQPALKRVAYANLGIRPLSGKPAPAKPAN